jgi:hypothetical protein
MAAFSSGIVTSAVFGVRNYNKGNDGHTLRYAVAAGQAKRVIDFVSQLDNSVGKTTRTATEALSAASKGSIFLDSCGKVAEFSSKHINPLIVASAAVDIINSEDKTSAAVTSATALGTMFTVEKFMKKHLKDIPKMKCFERITKAVENATKNTKYGKYIGPVLEGVAFVFGSCTAYNVGEKIGKSIVGDKTNNVQKQPKLF